MSNSKSREAKSPFAGRKGLPLSEACAYIGNISNSQMYKLMAEGLRSYTIGNRRYFLVADLDAFIESQLTPFGRPR